MTAGHPFKCLCSAGFRSIIPDSGSIRVIGIYRSLNPAGVCYAQSTVGEGALNRGVELRYSYLAGFCPSCCDFGFVEAKPYAWIR